MPLKLVSGDDSTTGTGDIVLDWTNINGKKDIEIRDNNNTLLDYYFETFDLVAEEAVAWVYNTWTRDGTVQAKINYGDGDSDQSVALTTVFANESTLERGFLLNESSGNAIDIAGNADATINDSPTREADGVLGKAYNFDGSNDYLLPGAIGSFNTFTTIVWVNLDTLKDFNDIIGGEFEITMLARANGAVTFGVGDGGAWGNLTTTSTGEVSAGSWFMYTLKGDGTNIEVYLNKTSKGTGATTDNLNTTPYIGTRNDGGPKAGYATDGRIDNIRIYSSELNDNEIEAIYDGMNQTLFSQSEAQSSFIPKILFIN
jgi:hypothetical protein